VTELPSAPPTSTFSTVTFHVPPPTPTAAASFETAKYLQILPLATGRLTPDQTTVAVFRRA